VPEEVELERRRFGADGLVAALHEQRGGDQDRERDTPVNDIRPLDAEVVQEQGSRVGEDERADTGARLADALGEGQAAVEPVREEGLRRDEDLELEQPSTL